MLRHTGFVVGWLPNTAAQLRYVKELARVTVDTGSCRKFLAAQQKLFFLFNIVDTLFNNDEIDE